MKRREWLGLALGAIATPAAAQTQSVTSFTLINADTDQPITGFNPIASGATLDLATLPTRRLNIRANTSPMVIGSVRFGYDLTTTYRIENVAPYALAGDTAANYGPWIPALGAHMLKATPYTGANATGTAGTARQLTFTVIDTTPVVPTTIRIADRRFLINGAVTYPGSRAEGLLMNARMVNSIFEDANRPTFNPEANTNEFLVAMEDYVRAGGLRAFTICLQGGNPGYEGARNTAFTSTGALRSTYMARAQQVIEQAASLRAVIILTLFYVRQDQYLADETAVRAAVVNTARWVTQHNFTNVMLEIANEYPHPNYDHAIIRTVTGMVSLITLAKQTAPALYVSASGMGDGRVDGQVAAASNYILLHMNSVSISSYAMWIGLADNYGKPVVINEDPKSGTTGAQAAATAVSYGASWGYYSQPINQAYPFAFHGTADDPTVYTQVHQLITP